MRRSARHSGRIAGFCIAAVMACTLLSGCSTIKQMFTDEDTTPPLKGERISVLQLQHELVPNPELKGDPVTLPDSWTNKFWPQSGGYPNHALGNLNLKKRADKVWSASIGKGGDSRAPLTAAPVVAEGVVYTIDAESNVSAFNLQDGKRKWQVSMVPKGESDKGGIGAGLAFASGRLYAVNGDRYVVAINPANGANLWKAPLQAPARSAPTIMEDRLYVVTLDNRLSVFNANDGKPLWNYTGVSETTNLLGSASPAADSTLVVLPMSSGEIFGLRPENGQMAWEDNLSAVRSTGSLNSLSDIKALPVIDQGVVYAVSFSGRMVALDEVSGNRIWQREIGSSETPWAAGDTVFVLTSEQQLIALTRASGDIRWVTQLPRYEEEKHENPVVWSGPVLAGDRLVVVSTDGQMLDISPQDGSIFRTEKTGRPTDISPVVADNTLLILTKDGELIAYR
ncbi:MAG: PQQ-binding-like beta-propeller repeat protein [Micavibrio sp.]|nr:PQQ-binding-like beta-propeller repeat protein [Micavibrio sp.]